MKISVLSVLILFLYQTNAIAQEPVVSIDARVVRASPAQIERALAGADNRLTAEQTASVLAALKDLNVEFLDQLRAVVRAGQTAKIDAVREVRFPIKFEADPKTGGNVPTEFATRNAGVALEFAPVVDDGGQIELGIIASVVTFRGFVDYGESKPGLDASNQDAIEELLKAPLTQGGLWQPIFTEKGVNSTVVLASGQTAVFGLLTAASADSRSNREARDSGPAEPTDHEIFLLVTAKILPD